MATQQQAVFLDTVMALKKAVKRKAYESDSDESVELNTNRGHKLQKRARFVKKGNMVPAMTPAAYKENVELAGYQRAIINRNPPLIDDEGYAVESDDDEDRVQEAIAEATEANPYSSVHLEQIFAPLTSVTDLPNHPTLSRSFTSNSLSKLTVQARDLMQKENKSLWRVKHLLTRLQGDHTWAPCSMMIEPTDGDLFNEEFFIQFLARPLRNETVVSATKSILTHGEPILPGLAQKLARAGSEPTTEQPQATAEEKEETIKDLSNGNTTQKPDIGSVPKPVTDGAAVETEKQVKTDGHDALQTNGADKEISGVNGQKKESDVAEPTTMLPPQPQQPEQPERPDVEMAEPSEEQQPDALPLDRPMNGGSSPDSGRSRASSPTRAAVADDLYIHPLFLAPRSARPDRDQGLPENEAEDVRRLVQLYVQKQEEVCRGTKRLYEGLLRADRYRKTVLRWAKAEAHCGPNRDMSDGEDWYDWEEWGLTEDLKKGADEEEEETAPQKKTRNRK